MIDLNELNDYLIKCKNYEKCILKKINKNEINNIECINDIEININDIYLKYFNNIIENDFKYLVKSKQKEIYLIYSSLEVIILKLESIRDVLNLED